MESRALSSKFLVVDDHPLFRDALQIAIHSAFPEAEIIEASSVAQARERLSHDQDMDLVLLDLMMPDMDGWEVYQQMKADPEIRDIPVIIVTAKAQNIDKILGLHIAKVNDYITKPFGPSELLQSIQTVLGRPEETQPQA